MAAISDRLKELMADRGLRQADILRLCRAEQQAGDPTLTKADLCQYVGGKVRPGEKKLKLMARALQVSEGWLLGYTEDPAGDTDAEIRQYLQFVKDNPEYRMMFDLCGSATLEEIRATVAFLQGLRKQGRDDG